VINVSIFSLVLSLQVLFKDCTETKEHTMTKLDREELDRLLGELDYWTNLSYTKAIECGVTTKKEVLKELKGR